MEPSRHHAVLDGLNQILDEPTAILCTKKGPWSLTPQAVVWGIQPSTNIRDHLREIGEQGVAFIQCLRSGV
jgi:hypothetical protein